MELLVPILVIAAVAFAAGALVRHWLVVPVAASVWPLIALGTWLGAWGHGFGDNDTADWLLVTMVVLYTASATVGATLGVVAGKRYRNRHAHVLPSA
jgi:uncharacterized membrane protein YfcA